MYVKRQGFNLQARSNRAGVSVCAAHLTRCTAAVGHAPAPATVMFAFIGTLDQGGDACSGCSG